MQPITSNARALMMGAFIAYKESIGKTKEQAEVEFNQLAGHGPPNEEERWKAVVEKYENKERSLSEENFYQHALKKVGTKKQLGERKLSEEEIAKINDIFGGEPIEM